MAVASHFPPSYWRKVDRAWDVAKVDMEREMKKFAEQDRASARAHPEWVEKLREGFEVLL